MRIKFILIALTGYLVNAQSSDDLSQSLINDEYEQEMALMDLKLQQVKNVR